MQKSMKFAEWKNIDIVNCDFNKLTHQKTEIEERNKKIKKQNKQLIILEIVAIALLTLFVLAVGTASTLVVWTELQFNAENTPGFFLQFFPGIDPVWIKWIVIAAIILLCLTALYLAITLITVRTDKKKKPLELLPESVYFAIVADNNKLGNFNQAPVRIDVPFAVQNTSFSFDAVNDDETEFYSFASAPGKWKTVLMPGIYKTIINVEDLIVYVPYVGTGDSLEDLYMQEKLKRIKLEEQLKNINTTHESKQNELAKKAALADSTHAIFEKEVIRLTAEAEELRADKYKLKMALEEANEKAAFGISIIEAKEKAEKNYEELLEKHNAQSQELRLAVIAKDDAVNSAEKAQKQHEERVSQIQKAADANLAKKEEDYLKTKEKAEKTQKDYEELLEKHDAQTKELRFAIDAKEEAVNSAKKAQQQHEEQVSQMQKTADAKLRQTEKAYLAEKERAEKAEQDHKVLLEKHNAQTEKLRLAIDSRDEAVNAAKKAKQQHEEHVRQMQEAAAAKLAQTEECCQELMHEKDLAYQQLASEHAEELSEKQLEFDELYRDMVESKAAEIEALRASAHEDAHKMLTRIKNVNVELDNANKTIAALQAEHEGDIETIKQLEHNAKAAQLYHKALEEDYNKLKEDIAKLREKVKDSDEKEKAWLTAQGALETQKKEIEMLDQQVSMLRKQKETLEVQLHSASELSADTDSVRKNAKEMAGQLEAATKKNRSLEQGNNDMRSKNKRLTEELEAANEMLEKREKDVKELSTRLDEANRAKDRVTDDLLDMRQKYNASQSYVTSLESQLQRAYKSADEAKATAAAEAEKRNAEGDAFSKLIKEREEQVRKAREDAIAANKEKK